MWWCGRSLYFEGHPTPPHPPYFFTWSQVPKIKISKTLFLRFLKYKKLSAFCILICNWDERKTKATEESLIASVWASNMEENKSLKRISQRKKVQRRKSGVRKCVWASLLFSVRLDFRVWGLRSWGRVGRWFLRIEDGGLWGDKIEIRRH